MGRPKKVLFSPRTPVFQKDNNVGFISVFYAMKDHCLRLWERNEGQGCIRRVQEEQNASSIQILGPTLTNNTRLAIPVRPFTTLGIHLPFMVMVMKNLNRVYSFDVQVLDDKGIRRRLQFGTKTMIGRKCRGTCFVPLGLNQDWNEVTVNLQHCTNRAYGTNYVETIRIQVYPNCRLRQIYFSQKPITLDKALSITKTLLLEASDTFDLKSFTVVGGLNLLNEDRKPSEKELRKSKKKKHLKVSVSEIVPSVRATPNQLSIADEGKRETDPDEAIPSAHPNFFSTRSEYYLTKKVKNTTMSFSDTELLNPLDTANLSIIRSIMENDDMRQLVSVFEAVDSDENPSPGGSDDSDSPLSPISTESITVVINPDEEAGSRKPTLVSIDMKELLKLVRVYKESSSHLRNLKTKDSESQTDTGIQESATKLVQTSPELRVVDLIQLNDEPDKENENALPQPENDLSNGETSGKTQLGTSPTK